MRIESRSNETVKRVRSLSSRKGRLEHGVHLIEGRKLLQEAIASGMTLSEAFFEEGHELEMEALPAGVATYTVTRSVMEAVCDTSTPQHVCATVKTPSLELPQSYPKGLL
ncbi:MAG: RNA methyltransferase substrate-binding domain-containing protein, partial [Bacillota bacterium]